MAEVRNIIIDQGSTWRLAFTYCQDGPIDPDTGEPTVGDPYDLTDCHVRMQVRKKPNAPEALITISDDPGDGVVIDPLAGEIVLTISDEKSEAIGPLPRDLVGRYDVKLYWPSGDETRLWEGKATIRPATTWDAP